MCSYVDTLNIIILSSYLSRHLDAIIILSKLNNTFTTKTYESSYQYCVIQLKLDY